MEPENGHDTDPEPALAREISVEIAAIKASTMAGTQQGDVATSFLCDARSYARAGKLEHAERKRAAARTVLTGEGEE